MSSRQLTSQGFEASHFFYNVRRKCKEAIAAKDLLGFAVERRIADAGDWVEAHAVAWMAIPDAQKAEIQSGLQGIAALIDRAFANPDSPSGLFEDAGISAEMQTLLHTDRAAEHWQVLYAALLREADLPNAAL